MAQNLSPNIAIVGGGITGITLAIGLLQRGINVTVYEQAQNFTEIGAGVAFGPNAARAMERIDRHIKEAFDKVSTGNLSEEKADIFFDYVDGFNNNEKNGTQQEDWLFNLKIAPGGGGAHRAHFLEELVKLMPSGVAQFNKHLDSCVEHENNMLELKFHDGTTASHDAIIGCDGIKSRVRAIIVGEDDPMALPTYTHKYAYRGLIAMNKAIGLLGDNLAGNSHMHLGPKGHILTFPVNHGKILNVVAFRQDEHEWKEKRLTAPAHKADVLRDYSEWHPTVTTMLEMLEDDVDRWAIFDTGTHPLDTYCKGRICLAGDAAHASSPHHGAGAGACIEDGAVMSELVVYAVEKTRQGQVSMQSSLEAAFSAFDFARRGHTQWLVQSSRHTGNLYDWMDPEAGRDSGKIFQDLSSRSEHIWNWDLDKNIQESLADLDRRLINRRLI